MLRRKKHSSQEQQDHQAVQEHKVKDLRAVVGPLSNRSSLFCNNACLRRYLEARNWNVDKSKKMLEETLKWRATFKPEEIRWHQVATEGETGKAYRADFRDREGRSVIVMRPAKQNTSSHEGQLRHLVYLLENAIINLPDGQEKMIWLVDFTGWSLANSVPIKTARETARVLQSHYPERLAVAFLYDPPRIFESFWKIIKYFLDPKTFQKVKFVYPKNAESRTLMAKNFDLEMLPEEFGGKNKVQYDHEEFAKRMVEDDIKMAALWGLHENPIHGNSASEVAQEHGHVTAPAS